MKLRAGKLGAFDSHKTSTTEVRRSRILSTEFRRDDVFTTGCVSCQKRKVPL